MLSVVFGRQHSLKNSKRYTAVTRKTLIFWMSLTLSLLLMTQEAFVDSVDQDQTAQSVQSDL